MEEEFFRCELCIHEKDNASAKIYLRI